MIMYPPHLYELLYHQVNAINFYTVKLKVYYDVDMCVLDICIYLCTYNGILSTIFCSSMYYIRATHCYATNKSGSPFNCYNTAPCNSIKLFNKQKCLMYIDTYHTSHKSVTQLKNSPFLVKIKIIDMTIVSSFASRHRPQKAANFIPLLFMKMLFCFKSIKHLTTIKRLIKRK